MDHAHAAWSMHSAGRRASTQLLLLLAARQSEQKNAPRSSYARTSHGMHIGHRARPCHRARADGRHVRRPITQGGKHAHTDAPRQRRMQRVGGKSKAQGVCLSARPTLNA
eukprot:7369958-Prymnesium_polylepis.1